MFKAYFKAVLVSCLLLLLVAGQAFALGGKPAEPVSEKPAAPQAPAVPAPTDKARVEVAFVLDTTGSMSGLIDGAKKKIWAIANSIVDANPNAEVYVGLVGYRDLGDEYVTKHFPITTDIQSIYGELLSFRAAGGGDTPESVNEALDVAVSKLNWSAGAQNDKTTRIIFLVGDAPPHMDYPQDRKYPEVIKEAVAKGIIVNTVQAGNMGSTTKFWREMAQLGGGEYHAIPQDGGRVVVIVTPYDKEIYDIQVRLSRTVVPYGAAKVQSDVKRKQEMFASESAASLDMAGYVNKSGKGKNVITGAGDLVDAVEAKSVDLASIKKELLPENMKSMSPLERDAYIKKNKAERDELSTKLKSLSVQRDEFIRAEEVKMGAEKRDSFDNSVSQTIAKQMKK